MKTKSTVNILSNHAMPPNILFGLSEKLDGSMYLGNDQTRWKPKNVKNRQRFFAKLRLAEKKIIALNLAHGTHVTVVNSQSEDFILGTDGAVTRDPKVVLTVTVADCIPVYFADAENKVVGLAHAGWRGIVAGIVTRTLEAMRTEGTETIKVALGPGICAEHFEIQRDIVDRFASWPEAIIEKEGKIFVDLKATIKKQLDAASVLPADIDDIDRCTYGEPKRYFSYRRDKPAELETMVAYITLRS